VFSGREQRLQLTLVACSARRACLFTRCERMEAIDVRAPRSLWRWLAVAAVVGIGVLTRSDPGPVAIKEKVRGVIN
jgi:hypothetical protein